MAEIADNAATAAGEDVISVYTDGARWWMSRASVDAVGSSVGLSSGIFVLPLNHDVNGSKGECAMNG